MVNVRKRLEVIFEFTITNPVFTHYRAVQKIDGTFWLEKQGRGAKSFRTVMRYANEGELHLARARLLKRMSK